MWHSRVAFFIDVDFLRGITNWCGGPSLTNSHNLLNLDSSSNTLHPTSPSFLETVNYNYNMITTTHVGELMLELRLCAPHPQSICKFSYTRTIYSHDDMTKYKICCVNDKRWETSNVLPPSQFNCRLRLCVGLKKMITLWSKNMVRLLILLWGERNRKVGNTNSNWGYYWKQILNVALDKEKWKIGHLNWDWESITYLYHESNDYTIN